MPKTILLVDDDPNIRDTAKDILEEAGYAVTTAGTCAEAEERLGEPFDVLLIDFNLPDGKGVDFARNAKAAKPALRILLMTGEGHVDLSQGASAFQAVLTKPVNPPELLEALRQIS